MKYYLLLAILNIHGLVLAQSGILTNKAQEITYRIQNSESRLTPNQMSAISNKLDEIKNIIENTSPTNSNYVCAARDNDNRPPYVYALRTGITIGQRISETQFSTLEGCQTSMARLKYPHNSGKALNCFPRDKDGRPPYVLSILNGSQIQLINETYVSDLNICYSILENIINDNSKYNSIFYCAPRDKDGRGPYSAFSLDLSNGKTEKGSESFSELNSCFNFLKP